MKSYLPILLIVASVGLGYLYLRPMYFDVTDLRKESQRYDDVLSKSVELREVREQLSVKLESFSPADLENIEKMIPENLDIVHLILDMNNVAIRHGIVMQDINSNQVSSRNNRRGASPSSDEKYETMAVNFMFQSQYENFTNFLRDLEESLRVIDVVSMDINPVTADPNTQLYQLTVHTYWLP